MQSLILGTAQWGMDYGITNAWGRLDGAEIREILQQARALGIELLDTAPAYGDAEARVGALAAGFRVQTKVSCDGKLADHIRDSVEASISSLERESVDAVLVHDWASLDDRAQMLAAGVLEALREEGLVAGVGVSAYDETDVTAALRAFDSLDLVQVPVSVLDQRLTGSRSLADVRDRGGRVQARSVLLQGAAVARAEHPVFGSHPDVVRLRESGNPLALCLGFVSTLHWVDELVLAVTSADELTELMEMLEEPVTGVDWSALASRDPWLVDPRQWTAPTRE